MTCPDKSILAVCDLHKSYGSIEILHGVTLALPRGEAVGLIGENGAGKSTLVKCLNGLTPFDSGHVDCDGNRLFRLDAAAARARGIITIPQEFDLEEDLTVAENIFLGREPTSRFGLVRHREMRRKAAEYLRRLNCNIDPAQPVRRLGVAEKQFVEIAKALSQQCRLLILDEPTTVLNHEEVQRLFEVLEKLKKDGTALLFISHRLPEVLQLCERVAVLRDGTLVHEGPASGLTPQALAELMVGRKLSSLYPPLHRCPPDAPELLRVENLSTTASSNARSQQ